MDKEFFADKFAGCLLGLAIGDAMGVPVNGLSPYEIIIRFHTPIDGFYPCPESPAGTVSNETAAAIGIIAAMDKTIGVELDAQSIPDAVAKAPYSPSLGAYSLFTRFAPLSLAAAATGVNGQPFVDDCKKIGAALSLSKKNLLAAFIFAETLREIVRNSSQLTKPYELYDSDNSLLSRLIQMCIKSELRLGEEGADDRLSERLVFVQRKLQINSNMPEFMGLTGKFGGIQETLQSVLFSYMRAPDEFETVCRMVSMGQTASTHGAMIGTLVGATIGASLLPQDMKDQLRHGQGLAIESLALKLSEKYFPAERASDEAETVAEVES